MFPRRKRLNRADFPSLRAGERRFSPHFLVIILKEVAGYAVVIPKKVIRLSTARHRLKRQIVAVLRQHILPSGLVVFPRPGAGSVSYTDIKTELGSLLAEYDQIKQS